MNEFIVYEIIANNEQIVEASNKGSNKSVVDLYEKQCGDVLRERNAGINMHPSFSNVCFEFILPIDENPSEILALLPHGKLKVDINPSWLIIK